MLPWHNSIYHLYGVSLLSNSDLWGERGGGGNQLELKWQLQTNPQ